MYKTIVYIPRLKVVLGAGYRNAVLQIKLNSLLCYFLVF